MFRQLLNSFRAIVRLVFSRRVVILCLALVLLVVDAAPGQAAPILVKRKISGLMPNDFSDVVNFWISPNSQYVVFTADLYISEMDELYSVRLPYGEPVKLSGMFTNGGSIDDNSSLVAISSDSQRVVYIADQESDGKNELYSAPIDGSAEPVKLNRALSYYEDVFWMEISPDGQRVVYLVDNSVDKLQDLYSVPIGGPGAASERLGQDLVADRIFKNFKITPDSLRVVYLADDVVKGKYELYSVRISGSYEEVKLSGTVTGFGVKDFAIAPTPGVQKVIFTAYARNNSIVDLFANRIDLYPAPALMLLSAIPYDVDMRQVVDFAFTSDSQRVVYSADQETNTVIELLSTFITGGTPVRLSGTLGLNVDVDRFTITPNNLGVVWQTMEGSAPAVYHLYGNYIDGSVVTPVPLDNLPLGRTIKADEYRQYFAVTPNSAVVVYIADQNTLGKNELYGNSTMGGTSTRLSAATMQANGDVANFRIAGNAGVVYLADQETDDLNELYYKAFAGGQPLKLNLPLLDPNSDVLNYQISPNNLAVVYRADGEADEKVELYLWYLAYPTYVPLVSR